MDLYEFFQLGSVHPEDWREHARRRLDEAYDKLEGAERHAFINELRAALGVQFLALQAAGVVGEFDWESFRKRLKGPKRYLEDVLALGRFSRQAPRLFDHLKILEPNEVARLARLGPEVARELYPEAPVEEGPMEE
jgi:hypothetical protein